MDAKILILLSFGKDQEKFFPHRHRSLASGAVKRGRFEFFKIGFPHENIINRKTVRDKGRQGIKGFRGVDPEAPVEEKKVSPLG